MGKVCAVRVSSSLSSALLVAAFAAGCSAPDVDALPAQAPTRALTAAQCGYFQVNGTTRICHATGSARNPFVLVNVAEAACVAAHSTHPRDYLAVNDPTCGGNGCLPASAPCDATLPCCSGLTCRGGACQATDLCAGITCNPGNQCHVASCDPATGRCLDEPKVDGFECSDGDACTRTDTCQTGACVGGNPVVCTALDQCHLVGTCGATSGTCSNPVAPDSAICVGGNPRVTANIVLAATPGPLLTGMTQRLTATITDAAGVPLVGKTLQFIITGANPGSSGAANSDGNGVAPFEYVGLVPGTDTISASVQISGQTFASSTASVHWLTPVQPHSTLPVRGRFFASSGSGVFTTPFTATPAFEQFFPAVNFNPPSGTIPGNTSGISVFSRPMTDITTDINGNFTGTIVAEGNGAQAGVGSLFDFQAVFTSSLIVASPGDVRFDFFTADGFIFAVGDGASRVSGPLINVPPGGLSPFESLPVVGAFNQPTAPVANSITVHFPVAGIYHYEIDYSKCCGGQLTMSMATSGHGIPPAWSLVVSPQVAQSTGTTRTLNVTAVDATNLPLANVAVTLFITGANARELTGITDIQGRIAFSYVGTNAGFDEVQAGFVIDGSPVVSNVVRAEWVP